IRRTGSVPALCNRWRRVRRCYGDHLSARRLLHVVFEYDGWLDRRRRRRVGDLAGNAKPAQLVVAQGRISLRGPWIEGLPARSDLDDQQEYLGDRPSRAGGTELALLVAAIAA